MQYINPHLIGIIESWATTICKVKARLGRRGGVVILYIKKSIQDYEIKLEKESECEEAVWCNIVTGNSTLTVGKFIGVQT